MLSCTSARLRIKPARERGLEAKLKRGPANTSTKSRVFSGVVGPKPRTHDGLEDSLAYSARAPSSMRPLSPPLKARQATTTAMRENFIFLRLYVFPATARLRSPRTIWVFKAGVYSPVMSQVPKPSTVSSS